MPRNKPMSPTQAEFLGVLERRALPAQTVDGMVARDGRFGRTLDTCQAKGWVQHGSVGYEITDAGEDALRRYRGIKS